MITELLFILGYTKITPLCRNYFVPTATHKGHCVVTIKCYVERTQVQSSQRTEITWNVSGSVNLKNEDGNFCIKIIYICTSCITKQAAVVHITARRYFTVEF